MINVKLAFCYPERLEKIKRGDETITYRKANSPVRLARPTDWNTFWQEVPADSELGIEAMLY